MPNITHLDPATRQVGIRRLDIRHDQPCLGRTRRRGRQPQAKRDRRTRPRRRELHDPKPLHRRDIIVKPPTQLLIKPLGPINIRHRDDLDLEPHIDPPDAHTPARRAFFSSAHHKLLVCRKTPTDLQRTNASKPAPHTPTSRPANTLDNPRERPNPPEHRPSAPGFAKARSRPYAGVAMSTTVSTRRLLGRHSECAALDQLAASVRAGLSRALVIRGEAGVGKSALLEYLAQHASGCGIARAAGVESEMELAYAGLQQLCAPFLDRLERLPGPQRDALGIAFGLRDGDAPDRFLVGLAVLSLLSDIAERQPRVCVVDDAQWLDSASAQALAFVARRLGAESVGLVLSVRETGGERDFEGLPELVVGGLGDPEARELLATVVTGPLDERVRDRIVAETRGNPLALLELTRGRTPAELLGGFGLPGGPPVPGRIEERFRERLAPLPPSTRLLVLLAAAEPTGDLVLMWRAAAKLGIGPDAATPAAGLGL